MPKDNRGNPYRCKVCGSIAGRDMICHRHREIEQIPTPATVTKGEHPPLNRGNYFEYGGYLGKERFFGSTYGIARDKFALDRDDE